MTKNCLFERLNLFLICILASCNIWVRVSSKQHNYLQFLSVYPVIYLGTRNYVHYEPALLRHSCCFGVAIVTGEDSNSTLISEAPTPSDGLIKILPEPGWIWALTCFVWTYFNATDMTDTRLLRIINVTGTGRGEVPLKRWLQAEKSEFRLYKELSCIFMITGLCSWRNPRRNWLRAAPPLRWAFLLQISYSGTVNILPHTRRGGARAVAGYQVLPVETLQGGGGREVGGWGGWGRICTYVF